MIRSSRPFQLLGLLLLVLGCIHPTQQAVFQGFPRARLASSTHTYKIAFDPASKYIAAGTTGGSTSVFDLKKGKLKRFKGHSDDVLAVDVSPGGTHLLTGGADKFVKLWVLKSGTRMWQSPRQESKVRDVIFSPCGSYFASAAGDSATVWSSGGALLHVFKVGSPVRTVSFSPDGSLLLVGGYDVQLWSVTSGIQMRIWQMAPKGNIGENPASFSPVGEVMAFRFAPDIIKVVDFNSGTELQLVLKDDGGQAFQRMSFSPDGELVAVGCTDKLVRIYSSTTGELLSLYRGHGNTVSSVAFSPDGKTLASAPCGNHEGDSIHLWDVDVDHSGHLQEIPPQTDTNVDGKFHAQSVDFPVIFDAEAEDPAYHHEMMLKAMDRTNRIKTTGVCRTQCSTQGLDAVICSNRGTLHSYCELQWLVECVNSDLVKDLRYLHHGPCQSCHDGKKNGDEEGVDCGGSCNSTCLGGGKAPASRMLMGEEMPEHWNPMKGDRSFVSLALGGSISALTMFGVFWGVGRRSGNTQSPTACPTPQPKDDAAEDLGANEDEDEGEDSLFTCSSSGGSLSSLASFVSSPRGLFHSPTRGSCRRSSSELLLPTTIPSSRTTRSRTMAMGAMS